MTTLIAVIISAALLWPGEKEKFKTEIPNPSSQISKIPVQVTDHQNTDKEKPDNLYDTDLIRNKESKENFSEEIIETNSQVTKELDTNSLEEMMATDSILVSSDSIQNSTNTFSKLDRQNKVQLKGTFSKNNKDSKYEYYDQKLDSTVFIDLNKNELEILGFKQIDNVITYLFAVKDTKKGFFLSAKGMSVLMKISEEVAERYDIDKQIINDSALYENKAVPMMITNKNGKGSVKWNMPKEWMNELLLSKGEIDFVNLIPVEVKKETFGLLPEEDVVFWFLPTEEFFNRLPREISEELLTEYEYITTEDKSALEKPECKYFDECKNTLDVSNFKVFPNPANSSATVSFTLNEPVDGRITLVDLAGRERQVLQGQTSFAKGSHRIDVDVSNVPEGIYLITLFSDKGIQTQRFIVTR